MRKKLKFFISSYLIFLLVGTFSCEKDDCGPFANPKQQLSEISGAAVNLQQLDNNIGSTEVAMDSVPFVHFGFRLNAVFKPLTNSQAQRKVLGFRVIESAYACTPPPPFTDDNLNSIEIMADRDFNSNYGIGSDLSSLFDLVEYESFSLLFEQRTILQSFVESSPEMPSRMTFVLNQAPETSEAITFTVRISTDSKNIAFYEFKSNPIVILAN